MWIIGENRLRLSLKIIIEYADAITIENLHTQMYQNLKLTLFFLEDPFP
jgi:hypothetical protein